MTSISPEGLRRHLLIQGITWSAAFQVLDVILSFGSMLILVRIIAPGDYGRAATVVGILGFVNLFGAQLFFEHALQLPGHEEPDWNLHWTVGFYVQSALALLCFGLGALCWVAPGYRPVAPLIQIAAIGILVDWPNRLGATMLRRQLQLRRLRIVAAIGTVGRLLIMIGIAAAGGGAYAIVIGNNVASALPFAVDLLIVRAWRPKPGWWRWPSWRLYSPSARFGFQRLGSNLIAGMSGALGAAVLPVPLGYAAIGLLNRAEALYGTTLGRIEAVLMEVVYPFLPRERENLERYAVHATTFLQVMLVIAIPGALFIGQQGPTLSRVLYGTKWVAMDPLIWPSALVGLAVSVMGTTACVMMAAGQVRRCVELDGIAAAAAVPALVGAWVTQQPTTYAWALAVGQLGAAGMSLWRASPLLRRDWPGTALLPPAVVGAVTLVLGRAVPVHSVTSRPAIQLVVIAAICGLSGLVVMRACFAEPLWRVVRQLPASHRLERVLLLRGVK